MLLLGWVVFSLCWNMAMSQDLNRKPYILKSEKKDTGDDGGRGSYLNS